MKTIIFAVTILLVGILFSSTSARSQGMVYISNLGQTSTGGAAVASNSWLAILFGTGSDPGGYTLNSVQLLMNAASGNPSGFTVSLYSFDSDGGPVNNLGSLNGSDPIAGGIFTYTTSGITLSASTDYWIVLTAATSLSTGAYNWSGAKGGNYNSSDGWFLSGGSYFSSNGSTSNWGNSRIGPGPYQIGVYATAVPEPSIETLLGLGGLLLLGIGRWKAKVLA